jgi:putative MATE family efflux protein
MPITEKQAETPGENKMGVMPVRKLLLSMSIPMMLSMLVQALYNIVDSVFVSRISENALAAVSLAFPVQNLMIAVSVGTSVGMNAYLSKSLGEKNFDAVKKTAANGVFLAALSCSVFMVAGFLLSDFFYRTQTDISEIIDYGRGYLFFVCMFSIALFFQVTFERLLTSTGNTIYAMISQMTGAVVNIILDPILIFGLLGFPKLGVSGAAIATIIGQGFGAGLALYFNITKNHEIRLSFRKFRPDGATIKRIYSVGLPSILMASIGSVMTYGINRILISFTATATAFFGVYFKLQSFVFMPVFGLNNGMVPILAYNYGARKKERMISVVKLSFLYAEIIMAIGTALFLVIPEKLLMMFNATGDMLAIGVPALRVICVHFPIAGFCIASISVFQALGSGIESLFVSITRQLIVLLPAAWLLSLVGSVALIWWAFPLAELTSFILCAFFARRLYNLKIRAL